MIGETAWNDHAMLIGRLMLAWTRATHQVLRVFTHLTGLGSPLAEVVYFSHTADAGQRKLVLAVADAVELPPAPTAELKRLFKRLEKVAGARNVAAHTTFGLSLFDPDAGTWGPKVVPALGPHVDRRRERDVVGQFKKAVAELDSIYADLEAWLVHTPFPDRLWGQPPFVGSVSSLGVPEPWQPKG